MPYLFKNGLASVYLLSIIIYISQGILYDGTWFSLLAGVNVLLFNLYFTARYLLRRNKQPLFPIHFVLLVWVIIIWAISQKEYSFQFERVNTLPVIQHIILVCTSFSSFYYLASTKILKKWVIVLFLALISVIFLYNILHYDVQTLGAGEYDYSSANNQAYPLTALIPMLVIFWERKWLMFLLMIAAFILVVICMKRGAMMCAAAFLIISLFYVIKQNLHKSFRHSIATISTISVILITLILVLITIYNDNPLLQGRFDHGSDTREFIYNRIVDGLYKSDFLDILIGHGPISTLSVAQNYAHNDWLEMVYDFGIIGLGIYVLIPLAILHFYKNNNLSYDCKAAIIMCLSYILIRSTFSMCIYQLESILIWGLLGLTFGRVDYERVHTKCK